ncbi:eukaryotic translation initiation factor 1A, putative [Eimeria tenella]|uniref:Eukaryotic translation initiation factor 1A, putative n=1 Tax=Eimeria tenella TaxID=5802 RepID=U6KMS2_EIMTE|nr:eukaryotic translation initiation factor 1A, putative [Eimeria tenella]CDJ38116.1 eukaryotic translation initiation factor 1A, putative [Eimeria tenella]|eukprot:XP_013228954.1 eukaryotic translation initiation factor 1A, putative [Eimeria tenella]
MNSEDRSFLVNSVNDRNCLRLSWATEAAAAEAAAHLAINLPVLFNVRHLEAHHPCCASLGRPQKTAAGKATIPAAAAAAATARTVLPPSQQDQWTTLDAAPATPLREGGRQGGEERVWVNAGDIVLVSLRDFQDNKGDVIAKYTPDEARALKSFGELPANAKINETDAFGEEDNAGGGIEFQESGSGSGSASEDDEHQQDLDVDDMYAELMEFFFFAAAAFLFSSDLKKVIYQARKGGVGGQHGAAAAAAAAVAAAADVQQEQQRRQRQQHQVPVLQQLW